MLCYEETNCFSLGFFTLYMGTEYLEAWKFQVDRGTADPLDRKAAFEMMLDYCREKYGKEPVKKEFENE